MNGKKVVAVAVVCVLLGVLVGYVVWGPRADRLASDLAAARQSLDEAGRRLTEQEARQRQLETDLQRARADLETVRKDFDAERQRRARLEALLGRGRK
jgi:uncharacterized protein HemX